MWVRKIQLKALEILARANTPSEFADRIPEIMTLMEDAKRDLRIGRVPLEELVIRQRLSRAIEAYKTPSPAARAARQLQAHGRQFAPGQSLEFLFARNASGVHAWEMENTLELAQVDIRKYYTLLDRAMETVLDPAQKHSVKAGLF